MHPSLTARVNRLGRFQCCSGNSPSLTVHLVGARCGGGIGARQWVSTRRFRWITAGPTRTAT